MIVYTFACIDATTKNKTGARTREKRSLCQYYEIRAPCCSFLKKKKKKHMKPHMYKESVAKPVRDRHWTIKTTLFLQSGRHSQINSSYNKGTRQTKTRKFQAVKLTCCYQYISNVLIIERITTLIQQAPKINHVYIKLFQFLIQQ